MMERSFSSPEHGGDGMELAQLLRSEDLPDGVHIAGETRHGQKTPAMAPGNVLGTSVLLVDVVERDPTGQVGHGLGPGPVGKVLVPGHDASEMGGLHEELVVPEAHSSPEELARGNEDGGVPEEIVERGRDAPGAERVEENAARLAGLVRVPLVEEVGSGMLRAEKWLELGAQELDLVVVEDPYPRQETVAFEAGKLLGREVACRVGNGASISEDRSVVMRQIRYHGRFPSWHNERPE